MKQVRRDPVTGDVLNRGEYVSWKIQAVIRRWTFLLIFLAGTAICWATRNDTVLLWWNLSASLLAIVIEFVVGLAMFGQTRRDAAVLREVRATSRGIAETTKTQGVMLERMDQLLEAMASAEERAYQLLQRMDLVVEGVKTGVLPVQVQEEEVL